MEDSLIRSTLTQGLPALGLGEELIPQLTEFSRLLLEKNQVMNLTAITEPREVATLHLLDSLSLAHRETYDAVVSRAVAALPVLCELCLPLVKVGGVFLAMKSSHSQEETDQAAAAISLLGGQLERVTDYSIPTTDIIHRLITIRKVSPTPKKYPRRFAQIKKQPLGATGA